MSNTTLIRTIADTTQTCSNAMSVIDPEIRLIEKFSSKQLLIFWNTLMQDPTRVGAYLDTMPTRLEEFLAPVERDEMYFWIILLDDEVAGAGWLHDVLPYNGKRSAWFGLYHAPRYRSVMGAQTQHALWREAERIGIPAIFAGTRHSNDRTKRFAERGGLHYVTTIEKFGWFGGSLDDLCIYTLRLEDRQEVVRQAEQRAVHLRAHPPVITV